MFSVKHCQLKDLLLTSAPFFSLVLFPDLSIRTHSGIVCFTNSSQLHKLSFRQSPPVCRLRQQCVPCLPLPPVPPPPLTFSLTSSTSLSSTMLTCKTPPHAVPSEQVVKLTVDSVEVLAPRLFTYNQDPIINSIQPSRSFVRSDASLSHGFQIFVFQRWPRSPSGF